MEISVISSPRDICDEVSIVNNMLEQGLNAFHLRKPEYSRDRLAEYIGLIKTEYYSRIVLHSHYDLIKELHLGGVHITRSNKDKGHAIIASIKKNNDTKIRVGISFHALDELYQENEGIDYAFLSPIFDSISKKDYKKAFDYRELKEVLKKTKFNVFALGGCRRENLEQIHKLGFYGAAFLGAIWNRSDSFDNYLRIKQFAKKLS
jgi:thiamine-phosphate pyrophosphorylase